ncbi:urease accessory protein UreF [Methylocella silvestris]|uniref:Urease accessory protein UreF n=1 Tax=Methylocella silvestris TaxID=199596 RepID=A0A2J7TDN4_METSI|nr:urease accessory UreF family protein [Methylocella silvestris]PNG24884.1 urease accessory protein UreF [Methylocella silvestris]
MLMQLLMMQNADAAFPSGGFAFSNGVEGLGALRRPLTGPDLTDALTASLRHRWAGADRVALIGAFRASDDHGALSRIDAAVEAATLAEPMRVGSKRNGRALLVTHTRLESPGAAALHKALSDGRLLGHLPVIQGALWCGLGLGEAEAVLISAYQAAASMATAAIRLGHIGAIDAQRSLSAALEVIADIVRQPMEQGVTPGSSKNEGCTGVVPRQSPSPVILTNFTPFIEIAAMRLAGADLRLFAN